VRAHLKGKDDPDPDDQNRTIKKQANHRTPLVRLTPRERRAAETPRDIEEHTRTICAAHVRTASQIRSAKLRGPPLTKTEQSLAFVRSGRDGEVSRTDLRCVSGPPPRCLRRRQPLPRCWCRRLPCRFRARSDASGLAGEATSEVMRRDGAGGAGGQRRWSAWSAAHLPIEWNVPKASPSAFGPRRRRCRVCATSSAGTRGVRFRRVTTHQLELEIANLFSGFGGGEPNPSQLAEFDLTLPAPK
jgi:hypothetical protein